MPRKFPRVRPIFAFELQVQFAHIAPAIWRSVLVQSRTTLEDLHGVIQVSFNWNDSHLYRFAYAGRSFMRPTPDFATEDATHTTLGDLSLAVGNTLTYAYDFGDGWELQVRVDAIEPIEADVQYPQCLAGARAGPPEDCGGPPIYDELLASLANPSHPEHTHRRAWVGPHFHPEALDLRATNRILALLFGDGAL